MQPAIRIVEGMVKFCFFGDNSCVLIVPSWRGQESILYRRADERYTSNSPISLVDQRQVGGRDHPDLAVRLTQRVRNLRGLRLTPHSAFFVCCALERSSVLPEHLKKVGKISQRSSPAPLWSQGGSMHRQKSKRQEEMNSHQLTWWCRCIWASCMQA